MIFDKELALCGSIKPGDEYHQIDSFVSNEDGDLYIVVARSFHIKEDKDGNWVRNKSGAVVSEYETTLFFYDPKDIIHLNYNLVMVINIQMKIMLELVV